MAIKLPPIPHEPVSDVFKWRDWLQTLQKQLTSTGAVAWSLIDFTGSKLTDIVSRNHNDLQAIQGGTTNDYQHLTTAQTQQLQSNSVLIWLTPL